MNRSGQLGIDALAHHNEYTPAQVHALDGKEITLVGCGPAHALAFTAKGEMYAWGTGKHLQLGTGRSRDEFLPILVEEASRIFSVERPKQALGNGVTSAVLTENGRVFIWGTSERIMDVHPYIAPYAPLVDSGPIAAIGVGWGHYLAATDKGQLIAWGWNQHGQLGLGDTEPSRTPKVVPFKHKVVGVAAGQDHSVVVTDKGEVYGFGSCQHGQLGLEKEQTSVPVPTRLNLPEEIVEAVCGMAHTLLRAKSGNVYACGWNSAGQSGYPEGGASVLVPTRLPQLDQSAVRLSAGRMHSACLTDQEHVWLWGHALALGQGGGSVQAVPDCLEVFHHGRTTVMDAVCGYDFTVFVTRELPVC